MFCLAAEASASPGWVGGWDWAGVTARPLGYSKSVRAERNSCQSSLLRPSFLCSLILQLPRRGLLGSSLNILACLRPGTGLVCGRMNKGFRESDLAEALAP